MSPLSEITIGSMFDYASSFVTGWSSAPSKHEKKIEHPSDHHLSVSFFSRESHQGRYDQLAVIFFAAMMWLQPPGTSLAFNKSKGLKFIPPHTLQNIQKYYINNYTDGCVAYDKIIPFLESCQTVMQVVCKPLDRAEMPYIVKFLKYSLEAMHYDNKQKDHQGAQKHLCNMFKKLHNAIPSVSSTSPGNASVKSQGVTAPVPELVKDRSIGQEELTLEETGSRTRTTKEGQRTAGPAEEAPEREKEENDATTMPLSGVSCPELQIEENEAFLSWGGKASRKLEKSLVKVKIDLTLKDAMMINSLFERINKKVIVTNEGWFEEYAQVMLSGCHPNATPIDGRAVITTSLPRFSVDVTKAQKAIACAVQYFDEDLFNL